MPTPINIWSMKYKRNLLVLLLVVTAAAGFTWIKLYSPFQPEPLSSSASETRAHWNYRLLPFVLPVQNNASPKWAKPVTVAGGVWESSNVVKFNFIKERQSEICDIYPDNMNFCSWNEADGWLSQMMYVQGPNNSHILAAVAAVNDAYLQNPKSEYNTDAWRNYILCQSFGWLLGVSTSTDAVEGELRAVPSCMNINTSSQAVKDMQRPDDSDINELKDLYSHSHDSPASSAAYMVSEANKLWKAKQFGTLVDVEPNGMKIYEQSLADGYIMKTILQPVKK